MERKAGKRINIPLGGRGIALVILVLVSTACFALGFFVGKATAPEKVVVKTEQVRVEVQADCPEPPMVMAPKPAPAPQVEPVRAEPKPPPPKRAKKVPVAGKPEPAAPPAVDIPAPPTVRYSVQVGAFGNLIDAEKLRKKFVAKGYDAYVLRDEGDDGKAVFKVRVGNYVDSDKARLLAVKIKSIEGIGAFIIRSQ